MMDFSTKSKADETNNLDQESIEALSEYIEDVFRVFSALK